MTFNLSAGLPPLHSTDDIMPASLPSHHLRNLLTILRRANEFYYQLAIAHRTSRKATHHAKSYASKIGLRVDIHKAINCPQREISRVALPIVDTTLSYNTPPARSATQDLYGPFQDNDYVVRPGGPVIPFDIPGLCRATPAPKRFSRKHLPPIIIPAVGSDRRSVVVAPRPVAPHERMLEMYISPTQPKSYFSAITPDSDTREIPVLNILVWDSNMSLQRTEQILPEGELLDVDEMDITEEVVLEEMDCEGESELRYPTPAPSSGSSSSDCTSSSFSSNGLHTPSEGSPVPVSVCTKRKSDDHYLTDITLGRKPPKFVRKDVQMGASLYL